jgi:hypothetical protein
MPIADDPGPEPPQFTRHESEFLGIGVSQTSLKELLAGVAYALHVLLLATVYAHAGYEREHSGCQEHGKPEFPQHASPQAPHILRSFRQARRKTSSYCFRVSEAERLTSGWLREPRGRAGQSAVASMG